MIRHQKDIGCHHIHRQQDDLSEFPVFPDQTEEKDGYAHFKEKRGLALRFEQVLHEGIQFPTAVFQHIHGQEKIQQIENYKAQQNRHHGKAVLAEKIEEAGKGTASSDVPAVKTGAVFMPAETRRINAPFPNPLIPNNVHNTLPSTNGNVSRGSSCFNNNLK
ncbi:MAG: hypothetical protein GX751_09950 [Desulfuromonadaceae bacterium]|nr:hypothetical protein [Desulfuromonadaceae bacterium]